MRRRSGWIKFLYGIGVLVFFASVGLGGAAALIVVFTLDDVRTGS